MLAKETGAIFKMDWDWDEVPESRNDPIWSDGTCPAEAKTLTALNNWLIELKQIKRAANTAGYVQIERWYEKAILLTEQELERRKASVV